MSSGELEAALAKVRPHSSSSLPHQKAPANLLNALEATFAEQSAPRTPAAYFGGLVTALEGTVQKGREGGFALGDGDLLPAELYLLALVCPYVPPPVIRANLDTLISLTSGLWGPLSTHAPPLRSQLSIYDAVLRALDRAQLENHIVRQSFATVLKLCLDARPKVRRRAADLVRDVISSPPSPLMRHPYCERVGEWSVNALGDVSSLGSSKQKGKRSMDEVIHAGMHLLTFLRPILPCLPSSVLPTITTYLLTFPRLGNPYLSQSAYSLLSDLLSTPDDPDTPRNIDTSMADFLNAIINVPPLKTDVTLLPSWVQVVGKTMVAYASTDPDGCAVDLLHVWKTLFSCLESLDATTRKETAASLACLTQCMQTKLIDSALSKESSNKNALVQIISQLTKALDALAFVIAIPEVLEVISALFIALRYRPGGREAPTAAELLLMPLIQKIGDMRIKNTFEYKEHADNTLAAAMSVIGPEALLNALPLNLELEDRAAGREPHAFLLPLLANPHPSPLRHFTTYFVPLSERLFDMQQKAEAENRSSEAKVWSVLVSQIWRGLPAYCFQTPDLRESLVPQFSQMLSHLLYTQIELRPFVLKTLKVIVDSNTKHDEATPADGPDALTEEELAKNRAFLRQQSESWFAVLFNVYGSVESHEHGLLGEVISTWASIADEKEMGRTCKKVIELLKGNLDKLTSSSKPNASVAQSKEQHVVTAMQDILVLLIPYISKHDAREVIDLCFIPDILQNKDNAVQKRAYKLLSKLAQANKVEIDAEDLYAKLDEVAESTLAAAKKDRFNFLNILLSHLPNTSLHVIPSIIPEAVLGTKEPSEKARMAAFDLIVAMGYKMKEGGIVKRHKLSDMDEDSVDEAPASLQEYFTMVAGGLAGTTPHMISASITAISRLVYEFKDDVPAEMHREIFLTLLEYLKSANREIVKSTLGYVKLFIHTLSVELFQPYLKDLVQILLSWSHDHKNHFKAKVRHIFERLIRRCGWDAIYSCAGSDDASKVLLNIKKRKDRAKRKKMHREEDEDDDEEAATCPVTTGDAFEDVLYGSESELDESDEEHRAGHKVARAKTTKKGMIGKARLRVDDDEPMDLLSGANTRITNMRKETRKLGMDAAKFKTDESTGKMLIDSDSNDEENAEMGEDANLAGEAYREQMTSVDSFTRGPRGRVKFHRNTKKRRHGEEDQDGEDVVMADAGAPERKKAQKNKAVKIGQEFKAKRAGGDVKKGGVDPYAYMPLSQAAKAAKGRGHRKITVTGKR